MTIGVGLAACSSRLAPVTLEHPAAVGVVESGACDPLEPTALLVGGDTKLSLLTEAIRAATERARECGEKSHDKRQCRSLFLLSATEPVSLWAEGGTASEIDQSVAVWMFATSDGLASTSEELAPMWEALLSFAESIGPALATEDEPEIARLVVARGALGDDLAVLEGFCDLAA